MSEPLRLMFVGFGEAASLFAKGLAREGLAGLAAYAPSVQGGAGQKRLHERAGWSGTHLLENLSGLSKADWVFAMVPPGEATNAAVGAAPHLASGAVYVDFSSASPEHKRKAADAVETAGGRYVDAGIIGSVPTSGHKVPVIASGREAGHFRATFAAFGMDISVVGEAVGVAAGTKLVRSILAKGLEALYVEALVVAERSGVTASVLDTFTAFLDARSARETAAILLKSHVIHAARRADEVAMARDLVAEAGVAPVMTDAIIGVMQATVATSAAERAGHRQPESLEAALAILETELPGPSPARN